MRDLNEGKLNELLGKMVGELGAATMGACVLIGDRLGLYRAMAGGQKMKAAEVAEKTSTHERYIREWLAANAASGYLEYDAGADAYWLTPEQEAVFADPESPASLTGGYYSVAACYSDEKKLSEAYKSGEGVGWGEHHSCLFCGTEKFFKPTYQAALCQAWIPALEGMEGRLSAGARVADIGCGHGVSTMIMAKKYPKSEFVGLDLHGPSIATAKAAAAEAGLTNVTFEVADSQKYTGGPFDLVCFFDCLHDMGNPVEAARRARESLKEDGAVMVVEPMAGDALTDNLNPVGRIYYAFSSMLCVPCSMSQPGKMALGAQAGEARLKSVLADGGLKKVKRIAETPFNFVLEARP